MSPVTRQLGCRVGVAIVDVVIVSKGNCVVVEVWCGLWVQG